MAKTEKKDPYDKPNPMRVRLTESIYEMHEVGAAKGDAEPMEVFIPKGALGKVVQVEGGLVLVTFARAMVGESVESWEAYVKPEQIELERDGR